MSGVGSVRSFPSVDSVDRVWQKWRKNGDWLPVPLGCHGGNETCGALRRHARGCNPQSEVAVELRTGGALAAGPGRRIASAMRRGRTPAIALVLAALALASVTAAASDPDDASIDDRSRERRRGARDGGAHPATVGEGSAGLVDVPFDAKPIRGVRGGEFPTAVPGGRARFLGGLEVTFTSPASSDETPDELDADPLSYGGWSSATGNADGSVAWILTDNYARLMRVELRNDARSGRLDGVAKIQDATNFSFRSALDGAAREIRRTPGTRIDTESIARIPHAEDGDAPGGDASSVLNDFVVGVEDARVPGLNPNNLLRFRHGVAGEYRDVPAAAEALRGDDACGVNLGPEAIVYLPSRYTFAGSLPEGAYPGSVIVATCEARDASGVIAGFIFDASSSSAGGSSGGLIGKVHLRGLGDALAPGRFQCGASDAALTPDGRVVVVLFRCYDFASGDGFASLRTVRADSLRVPGATVHVSPLMDLVEWPIGNVEGVHAFASGGGGGNDGAVGVLMVSDNNLSPTTKTQIVEFEVRGPLFDESVAAGAASSSSAVLGDLEGGGGDGATMPSPLRRPFRAAPWVGVRKRDARVGASIAGFAAVTALVAIGSIVGRRRSAVDSRRVRSETSLLLPR